MSLKRAMFVLLAAAMASSALELSGTVLAPDSTPRSGVVVKLASTGAVATTDSRGAWSLSGSAGIGARPVAVPVSGSRLFVENGHLRVSFQGRDLSGRLAAGAKVAASAVAAARPSGASLPDTLFYSYQGKMFLRDTVSASRAGIVRTYDPTWNAAILYGWLADSRDGQLYRTVQIGTQNWMAQNLSYAGSGVCYESDAANCLTYGRLYTWAEVMGLGDFCATTACSTQVAAKHRGICPVGWHVPSDTEWRTIESYVEADARVGAGNGGAALKSTARWNWGGGTDLFGFRALPGGSRYSGGSFVSIGDNGSWWSATENGAQYAWYRHMYNGYAGVDRDVSKTNGRSLRCVQDP